MEEVFDQSRGFFSLSLSQKMKLLRNKKNRGYSPLFDQVLDAANQIKGWCLMILFVPVGRQVTEVFGA